VEEPTKAFFPTVPINLIVREPWEAAWAEPSTANKTADALGLRTSAANRDTRHLLLRAI